MICSKINIINLMQVLDLWDHYMGSHETMGQKLKAPSGRG
jgi:hypothetical protein